MPRKNDSWGIEIGSHAIKAIRLVRHGSAVELADYEVLRFKKVLTTPDINVDEAIQLNLDGLMSKHDFSKTNVVVSVPGHMAFARFAKLPPVEPKKIPDIVRFEAVQQIPFPIDQVEWDYQIFHQEDSPDVEVGIFAITKERVLSFMANLRQVGLRVDALTLSPLAVFNAFTFDDEQDDPNGTIYMDIGTQSTDVIIVEHGGIWLRTVPIGGNSFTEALVKSFKLSFSKAEKLKREAGTSKYSRQIFQAMRPVFADLVQEMQRSLGYYQSINRDATLTRLVGIGSTFRLPGLQKFLKQQLQIEVKRPDCFKKITVEGKRESEFAERAVNLATAYGLALQGVGLDRVSANILPRHIMQQRLWRAKQPWIAAAAAMIALAAGLVGVRHFVDSTAFDEHQSSATVYAKTIINNAKKLQGEMNNLATGSKDPRIRIENLRRILDYRHVWSLLLADISQAARALDPQPETLVADYEKVRLIDRSERRRFYIEEVRSEFLVGSDIANPMGDGSTAKDISETFEAAFFWDPSSFGLEEEGMDEDSEDGEVSSYRNNPKNLSAPRFRVTVRGTTPHRDAAQFLTSKFIRWFKDNASRANRPYRLVLADPAINSRWDVVDVARTTGGRDAASRRQTNVGRGSKTRTASPYGGNVVGGMGSPGGMGMMGGVGGLGPSGGSMGASYGGRSANLRDMSHLFPERPLALESRRSDKGFEIVLYVELIDPEAARRAEHPAAPAEQTDEAEQAERSESIESREVLL